MNKKNLEFFDNAPIPKVVLANIIPSVISMLMALIYNLADTFFIAQTNNSYMVAASSLATPAFNVFLGIGLVFGIGGTSLISRMFGMGKNEEAKNVSAFTFYTGIGIGIIGMFIMWLGMDKISIILGASKYTDKYVKDYLSIIALAVPFLIISSTFSHILRSEGKAKKAMTGMIIGNITNIILDPILILTLGLDVKGAAIATVIGNIASASYYIYQMRSKNSMLSINIKHYKIKNRIASGVFSIGIPASLNSFLMTVSVIVTNNYMKQYGDMAIAAMGVATRAGMLLAMALIGIGSGVQPLFGYFYGSKNKKRFLETLKFTTSVAIITSIILTILVYFNTDAIVRAFLKNDEAFSYGVSFVRMLVISGPVIGILFVMNNAIQGMGAWLPSLLLSVSRQGLVYIPMLFVFDKIYGNAKMLIMAQPVADYLSVILGVLLFSYVYRTGFKGVKIIEKNLK